MTRKKFTPYLKQPPYDAKWWRTKAGGGISPCIAGQPNYCADKHSALANCVGWSWGRMAMLEDNPNCKIGCWNGKNYPTNAEDWVSASKQQGYKVGTVPKLGAVACWKHKTKAMGHVANVEQINADGSWLSSESAYKGTMWSSKKYPKSGYKKNYDFLGYIYPKDEWYIGTDDLKVGDKVKIVGGGNANSYGTGWSAGGVGYLRKIKAIYEGRPFPYQVGTDYATTGFYKESALKKI